MEPASRSIPVSRTIGFLHYGTPLVVAAYYCCATTLALCRLKSQRKPARRKIYLRTALGIMTVTIIGYIAEIALYVIRSLIQRGWWAPQDQAIFVLGSLVVWSALALVFLDISPVWDALCGSAVLAAILEIALCILSTGFLNDDFGRAQFALQIARIFFFVALASFILWLIFRRGGDGSQDEESRPLLAGGANRDAQSQLNCSRYGTNSSRANAEQGDDDSDDSEDEDGKVKEGSWLKYIKSFSVFIPYLWPSKNREVKLYILIMALCLISKRILNVLIPRQLGIIANRIAETAGTGIFPWKEVALWIGFRVVSSSAGIEMLVAAFRHVMMLSIDFHSGKDSGEVLRALQQGRALNWLVELVLFNTGPVLFDLLVALGYITHLFDIYFSFTVLVIGLGYIWISIKLTTWKAPVRRKYLERSRNEYKVMTESVNNWSTVAYFNRNKYEAGRYAEAVNLEIFYQAKLNTFNLIERAVQELVMLAGLLIVSFLAVYRISQGAKPVGNFITLVTYWNTLSLPLRTMAHSYRQITSYLVDAERLLQLLQTKPTVTEKANAQDLQVTHGRVSFNGVFFAYDPRKITLDNINFTAEPGKTVALVGKTGSGKSTILRLLIRFYDVIDGEITIDDQDIRDITLSSLRESIGVVPQDPVLFNDSILENVRYGRLGATDEEVRDACRAAAIHDTIMTFPDGYQTKVGERGVKLSGGELQRIAIARAILKDPKIVLLDEATSAVDSSTEAQIQKALTQLSQGRTTFIIAHRLSIRAS